MTDAQTTVAQITAAQTTVAQTAAAQITDAAKSRADLDAALNALDVAERCVDAIKQHATDDFVKALREVKRVLSDDSLPHEIRERIGVLVLSVIDCVTTARVSAQDETFVSAARVVQGCAPFVLRFVAASLFVALTVAFFFTSWEFCAIITALIAAYFFGFDGFYKFTAKLIAKAVAKAFGKNK